MFITKKHLPRRTFLRGAGAAVALPLLDAMLPAATAYAQTDAARVKRFVGVWHPHGAAPGYWSPLDGGRDFEFSFITAPLETVRHRTVLISGLDSTAAYSTPEEPGGNHARGAVFLSGVRPRRDAVSPYLGVTVDQLIAQKHGRDTLLSSIQLGIEDASHNSGNCNWGYSCAYTNSISWPDPATPLPTEINPRIAFERMFGDGSTPEERRVGRLQSASVLDSVTREIPGFKRRLAAGDQARLDDYLDDVREIERRIRNAVNNPAAEVSADVPFGVPQSKEVHYKLMYDLIALAFQADITRSATLMLGRDLSGTSLPESGYEGGWHGISHHGDIPANKAGYAKVNRFHVGNLAYFCEKLAATDDGDGSLLDHVLIYKGSNMGNSHRHAHEKVPTILVGGIDGTFAGNRHLAFADNTERCANLLLSILHLFDIERESFGESTHPLEIV
jgi:Protein of unknown function (DUF1552)